MLFERVRKADVLRRLFFCVSGCRALGQTRQREVGEVKQPIAGIWEDVPVPRKIRDETLGSFPASATGAPLVVILAISGVMVWNPCLVMLLMNRVLSLV